LGRSGDKHIDKEELDALVPWSAVSGEQQALSPDALEVAAPGADCPKDIEWYEVAAGLWPELKATQLISHAATCQHCGPLLRAATSVDDDPTPQEEKLLAQLKAPARPDIVCPPVPIAPALRPKPSRNFMRWLIPAVALIVIVGVLITRSTPLSGSKYAEEAVIAHRQHAQGNLPLEVRLDSQQALNEWLKAKAPFPLALPASPPLPGEERPYRLQGARLVRVAGKAAAYIAYQMQTGPASLMVTTDSVAHASGGVQVDYQKVSFHYRTVEGYKVVTWSMRGKTYALVSQEGNSTQQSCMVCHSAMRDRDLTHTPAPLPADRSAVERVLQ
jgi:anti-sigma factor RsiW